MQATSLRMKENIMEVMTWNSTLCCALPKYGSSKCCQNKSGIGDAARSGILILMAES